MNFTLPDSGAMIIIDSRFSDFYSIKASRNGSVTRLDSAADLASLQIDKSKFSNKFTRENFEASYINFNKDEREDAVGITIKNFSILTILDNETVLNLSKSDLPTEQYNIIFAEVNSIEEARKLRNVLRPQYLLISPTAEFSSMHSNDKDQNIIMIQDGTYSVSTDIFGETVVKTDPKFNKS